jgi:NAD(P)-dependent dehydrogenase (short-subunit alcohol dehydrogenase family)
MTSLEHKVVIVTGGSSGIGRAAALHFATAGASVLITGRRASRVEEAAKDHAHITGLVADAAEPEDAARTISKAIEIWGRLDILGIFAYPPEKVYFSLSCTLCHQEEARLATARPNLRLF